MRIWILRVLSCLFALSAMVVPGFGAAELAGSWDGDRSVALEAGWGLFFTVLVAVPFLLLGFAPAQTAATRTARNELVLAVVLLALTGLVTLEWGALAFAAGVAVEAYVLLRVGRPLRRRAAALSSHELSSHDPAPRPFLPVLVALLGVGPWVGFAIGNLARAYQDDVVRELTMWTDHYAVQAALGLAVPVLALLAAARPAAHAWPGVTAGAVACYLGTQAMVFPDEPGGLSRSAGLLALVWGLAVWGIVLRRPAESPWPAPDRSALPA